MSSATRASRTARDQVTAETIPFSRTLEWVLTIGMVLVGAVFISLGTALSQFADTDRIATWVADGAIVSTELTDAELIDATFALIWGGGIGLAATGGIVIVGGLVFLGLQTRARRRTETAGRPHPSTVGTAILGALVTLVTWFVPFSPVIGGAVTGYVAGTSRREAMGTGSLAGLFATVPVVVVSAAVTWALLVESTAGVSVFVGFMLTISLLLGIAYMVGLSAVGGYLGSSFAAGRRSGSDH
jgi:hypothetical protein